MNIKKDLAAWIREGKTPEGVSLTDGGFLVPEEFLVPIPGLRAYFLRLLKLGGYRSVNLREYLRKRMEEAKIERDNK